MNSCALLQRKCIYEFLVSRQLLISFCQRICSHKQLREIKRFNKFRKDLYIEMHFLILHKKIASISTSHLMLSVCIFTVCVYASVNYSKVDIQIGMALGYYLKTIQSVSKWPFLLGSQYILTKYLQLSF